MGCPLESGESAELIVGYAAGTLDPATRAAFELHQKSCGHCSAAVAAQKTVWAALDELSHSCGKLTE